VRPDVPLHSRPGADLPDASLWRNRGFRLFWLGETTSVLGNATTSVLMPLVAITQFDAGPFAMGVLTSTAWIPWLLVGLPAGAWLEGRRPRPVMIGADLVALVFLASVPVAAAVHALTLGHLFVVALGNGVCTVFFRAAYPSLIRAVVPGSQQEQAFARLFGSESAAQVVGPGLGGLVAGVASAAWGLVADAVSFAVSAACLARMRLPSAAAPPPGTRRTLQASIKEGVGFIVRDPLLRFFTVMGGVSNFGLTGYSTLTVLFLVRDAHLSPGAVGFVLALSSVGGLMGASLSAAATRRLGSARALLVLHLVAGPPSLVLALAGPGWRVAFVVLALVPVGVGVVASNVIRQAWRNRYVPPAMVARQVTTSQVVNFGTMPLAALAAGGLGSVAGLRATIALMAAIHALSCLSVFASPLRGSRHMPESPYDIVPAPVPADVL
jgi:predicted MFS family arabinose efflux permease